MMKSLLVVTILGLFAAASSGCGTCLQGQQLYCGSGSNTSGCVCIPAKE